MMEWADIHILWGLLGIVVLAIILFWWQNYKFKKDIHQWVLTAAPKRHQNIQSLKILGLVLPMAFILLALANLRKGDQPILQNSEGAEVIIALDISRSMLAKDIQPDRMSIAKNIAQNIVADVPLHRVGIIAFAGNAYPIMPMTEDLASLNTFIKGVNTDIAGIQGTNIAKAIELATGAFTSLDPKGKTMIIISDGEDHEAEAIDAAEDAMDKGLNLITIGVGTKQGAEILVQKGRAMAAITDNKGQKVISRLDDASLRAIANEARGIYIPYESLYQVTQKVKTFINNEAEFTSSSTEFLSYKYYYAYFLIPALFFILVFGILQKWNLLPRKEVAAVLVIGVFSMQSLHGQADLNQHRRAGEDDYLSGLYDRAYENFKISDSLGQTAMDAYNFGNAAYKNERFDEAIEAYEQALRLQENNPKMENYIYHNLGNTHANKGDLKAAVDAYKNALKINPNDVQTKENLARTLQMLKKQQQQQQQQQKPSDEENNKDEGDKNEDQNQQQKNQNQQQEQRDSKPSDSEMQTENLSEQQLERLLKAAEQDDQKAQKKLKRRKGAKTKFPEKDW